MDHSIQGLNSLNDLVPTSPTFPAMIPENQDWSFAHLKQTETSWGPHGYHRYPAKFIPQLVNRVIELYSTPGSLVGDTFLGSATTGVEALRTNRRFWGSDINPVALLISQAKCIPINPRILNCSWMQFVKKLETLPQVGRRSLTQEEVEIILSIDIRQASAQERLTYWFPLEYRQSLECLLQQIIAISDEPIRTFFLCAFSNILRGCSIWLSGSTKPQKDLTKTLSDPVEAFRKQVKDMLQRSCAYWEDLNRSKITPTSLAKNCCLVVGDARNTSLTDGELDLLVTSPPYATCYQYIEIHQLTQLWLEEYRILRSSDPRHSCIGAKDISSRETDIGDTPISTGSSVADTALSQLADLREKFKDKEGAINREVRALNYYFQDMNAALEECARVIARGKYLVLIIGNSYKRGITIPTSEALFEMATTLGFELEHKIVRKVPARVLVSTRDKKTGRFSSAAQSDTQVYPEEDILVFKQQG